LSRTAHLNEINVSQLFLQYLITVIYFYY